MKDVGVIVARFGGEVVPDRALNRMNIGRDICVLVRLRNDRWEHLEAVNALALILGRADTLNRESE